MPRSGNIRIVWGDMLKDYTSEDFTAIQKALAELQTAERAMREMNGLWRGLLKSTEREFSLVEGYRSFSNTKYARRKTRHSLRAARMAYINAIMGPPARKRMITQLKGMVRDSLAEQALKEHVIPPPEFVAKAEASAERVVHEMFDAMNREGKTPLASLVLEAVKRHPYIDRIYGKKVNGIFVDEVQLMPHPLPAEVERQAVNDMIELAASQFERHQLVPIATYPAKCEDDDGE